MTYEMKLSEDRAVILDAHGASIVDITPSYDEERGCNVLTPTFEPSIASAIVSQQSTIDALVAALELVRSMRTIEALAPAAYQSEIDKRREAWAKIDLDIDTALALARGGK
ncbi:MULTISPECIES: hypothetical protein [unclassified Mesorhizobium]|uniref:hypothetical protein n=1 Tax=unclassified Mesorhizobium TaxID=325217 RepID=UPI0011263572|nr:MULTISPECIES: hypothetical protein [unclassified Mesorhizobium]TPJ86988.1 hypothetical protein FJ489_31065 [Mesorhizobium sp. B2-5-12]TPK19211.1 hypothetical protein FJ562_31470 [Mesorhizobium sp. B2-5-6]